VLFKPVPHVLAVGDLERALEGLRDRAEVIVCQEGIASLPDAAGPAKRVAIREGSPLGAVWNAGLRASAGRFVVFLDHNERILPGGLESNLHRFKKNPDCGFVYGAYRVMDHKGDPLDHQIVSHSAGIYEALLSGNDIPVRAAVMYRRDRLEEAGGFDPFLAHYETHDVQLRLSHLYPIAPGLDWVAERMPQTEASPDALQRLREGMAVLRMEWFRSGGDIRWRHAYRVGVKALKRRYVLESFRAMRSGRHRLFRTSLDVLRSAPLLAAEIVTKKLHKGLLRSRPRGPINLGDLQRTTPISSSFGTERGKPLDRRYIEQFLASHAHDIRGRVLEVGDDYYTRAFGGNRVTRCDVLHGGRGNPHASLTGNLEERDQLPCEAFDCIILTQTLQYIFNLPQAVDSLHRSLKPGGVLLATVPGVSSVERGGWGSSWYWSLTSTALQRLLETQFPLSGLTVQTYGNVLSAVCFLHGLVEEDIGSQELDARDPFIPVIVAARATKEGADRSPRSLAPS
jgi:hypothetical protein